MQEKQILQHTKQAMEQVTPDCFDAIWERASNANPDEYPLPDDPLVLKKQRLFQEMDCRFVCFSSVPFMFFGLPVV